MLTYNEAPKRCHNPIQEHDRLLWASGRGCGETLGDISGGVKLILTVLPGPAWSTLGDGIWMTSSCRAVLVPVVTFG